MHTLLSSSFPHPLPVEYWCNSFIGIYTLPLLIFLFRQLPVRPVRLCDNNLVHAHAFSSILYALMPRALSPRLGSERKKDERA